MRNNLYIPSIDAKDLYLANNFINKDDQGYRLKKKDNEVKNKDPADDYNLKKFINSFDYSLDLIELRTVAQDVYGSSEEILSFIKDEKEYSSKVINITFKYAVKEYNEIKRNVYVAAGYNINELEFKDGYVAQDSTLIAIELEKPLYNKIPDNIVIPEYFTCEYNKQELEYTYKLKAHKTPKTKVTREELRTWIYENGFILDGIKYCRFKRSSGSARVGKCLFIDERLYPRMYESEKCGLDIEAGQDLDIAAFEAYISLPTSSIIDTLPIEPKNILVIDDYESIFTDDAICTDLLESNWLSTTEKEMRVCNSIWDGQSLLDVSLMGDYKDKGMLLLRNKFFKSCCFNTNIQKFFEDNNITSIDQLNGTTIATDIKDVKLITTPSSIKFFKFGKLETWLENIWPMFGIVKFDKNTHYFDGRMVQAHYQLLNTIQLSEQEVEEIVKDGLDYISLLNTDVNVMRYHLKFKADNQFNITNVMPDKNSIVYTLLNIDCGFEDTKTYYDFKKDLCKSYIKNMKRGHILIDGTYATLFGNPYEMLLQSIGKFTGESVLKPGTVHNIRYKFGEDLICCRSPHVTIGNILLTKNIACEEIDTYFNVTNNIICINSINENILERLSGADFDSDSMIISNNKILIDGARKNYDIFKVPTRNINPPKSKRKYSPKDLADLDAKTSTNKIGEIVNLSQELNSLLWDIVYKAGGDVRSQYEAIKEIYYDVCQLDVMSNIEIDKAKKEYTVDMAKELNKIRDKYADILVSEDGRKKMPEFLGFIAGLKQYRNDDKKEYKSYNTAMDYLHKCINGTKSKHSKASGFKTITEIFKPKDFNDSLVNYRQVEKIITEAAVSYNKTKALYANKYISKENKFKFKNEIDYDLLLIINQLKLNKHTMYRLLYKLENNKDYSGIKNYLFYILFNYKNDTLIEMLSEYPRITTFVKEDDNGELEIYGKHYKKQEFVNGEL